MRWIIRFVVLVVVVAALAVGALFLIPTERIAALIGDQFEKATGRSLAISGAIRPSLYPVLGVRADGIEIGNPGWVTDGPMLKAARLNLGVEAAALWGGEIKVQRFELVEPQIVLVKGADGAVSWTFGEGGEAPQEAESQGNALAGLSVELAEITDGTLYYRDLATGTEVRASALDLALRLPSAEGKARLEGSGMVNGATLSIDAAVEGIAPLLEGRLRPVTLALDWTGGKAGFEGRAGISPPSGEGTLSFDATDLAPLLALAGQGAPSLPKGLGRDRMVVSGTLTVAPEGSVHLRGTNITLDDNSVSGDIDVLTSGARPLIRARLDGGAWDLSAITGGESTPDAEAGWSRVPIDVSALNSADAEAVVTLAGLDLGIMDLGRLNVRAALSEGRLVLDLNEVAAYGGAVTGQYVVNGRGGLSMRGDITLSQVQLGPLLTDFAGFDRLQGTGDARVDVLMSGNDLNALMNSLQGTGSVEFGQGEILGLDIGGMIRNLDTSYRGEGAKTVYDSVTASFVMESGVVSNQDLVLIAKFGEMTGSGTIGVGQQVLDYTLIPRVVYRRGSGATDQSTAQEGADATQTAEQETGAQDAGQVADRELRVPLRIHGPWSGLKYSLDLEALAQEKLGEQLEVLQERAEQAAADALGITLMEGQTLQEAAGEAMQGRLEAEAQRQLQQMLGAGDSAGGETQTGAGQIVDLLTGQSQTEAVQENQVEGAEAEQTTAEQATQVQSEQEQPTQTQQPVTQETAETQQTQEQPVEAGQVTADQSQDAGGGGAQAQEQPTEEPQPEQQPTDTEPSEAQPVEEDPLKRILQGIGEAITSGDR